MLIKSVGNGTNRRKGFRDLCGGFCSPFTKKNRTFATRKKTHNNGKKFQYPTCKAR